MQGVEKTQELVLKQLVSSRLHRLCKIRLCKMQITAHRHVVFSASIYAALTVLVCVCMYLTILVLDLPFGF